LIGGVRVNGGRGLDERVRLLEIGHIEMMTTIRLHVASCDRRGARMERLAWSIGGLVIAILGVLLKPHFGM